MASERRKTKRGQDAGPYLASCLGRLSTVEGLSVSDRERNKDLSSIVVPAAAGMFNPVPVRRSPAKQEGSPTCVGESAGHSNFSSSRAAKPIRRRPDPLSTLSAINFQPSTVSTGSDNPVRIARGSRAKTAEFLWLGRLATIWV
jgi:hypothetical protein